jgi:2'-5' RNA ligase
MAGFSRLFFALWPDDKIRQELIRLRRSLQVPAKEFRWVPPHNFHVTLVFLGSIDTRSEALIKQSVASIAVKPFDLTFDRLTYWNKPKVLCLTCQQQPAPELMKLVEALGLAVAHCGIQTDAKPYTPHITLARKAPAFIEQECEPIVWRAESFCLAESCSEPGGVCYKVIEQWPFIPDLC